MTDTTPTPTPHRATPIVWGDVERRADDPLSLATAVLELRARVEALEAQQAQPEFNPEPEPLTPCMKPQTLHEVALEMVDSLGRSFNLLPEILDTLRRAIREPMDPPAPCPHIVSSDEGTSYCALAEQAQPSQPAAPAEAAPSELVEQVAYAIFNSLGRGDGTTIAAESAIRAVARWLRDELHGLAADRLELELYRLEQEAGR